MAADDIANVASPVPALDLEDGAVQPAGFPPPALDD
jgi:hypothetical protein